MELFDYKLTYEKIASLKAFKCSHCDRIFSTQVCNGLVLGRVPLLMPCSHTICEECIIRMAKCKKINCKVCSYSTILENPEKWPNLFPIDRYMFGALLNQNTAQTSPNVNTKVFSFQTHSLAGMIQKTTPISRSKERSICSQDDCNKTATMTCVNCSEVYCSSCDKRVHKSIRILKNHVRYPVDVGDLTDLSAHCNVHSDTSAEYYCFTCKSILCSKCIIQDHSGHAIISIEDKNAQDLPAFENVMKKARYLLKNMETTVKEVNMEITNSQKNFKPTQTEYEIIKHFSMLHSTLQILEASMLDKFYRGQASKIRALHGLSEELTSNIEILQPLISTGKMLLTNKNMDKLLISELQRKLEENLSLPCDIIKEKTDTKSKLQFIADNSILETLQKHCTINVEEKFNYKLIPKTVFDETKFIDDDSESLSVTSETDSTRSLNLLDQSVSSSSVSSNGGECNFKKKSGCRTRLTLSGSEPTFHSPANQQENNKKPNNKIEEVIAERKEYDVIVTHIQDPSTFYVQLRNKTKQIEVLTKKYASFAEHAVIPENIEIGKIYIVQYSDEKESKPKWYRGRVDNSLVAGLHNLYEVFFIDYGNTSYVPINKIRDIKNIFTLNPYFAHKCRLHGIMSHQETWNNNVLKDMVEFISCQHEIKMYVINNDKGILNVTLFSYIATMSEFLIIAGYAQKVPDADAQLAAGRRSFGYTETKISSSIQNFHKGQKYIVSVMHIINPLHMYIQIEQYKDVIANIETAMTGQYSKSDAKHFIFNPTPGMYCAALLTIKNESKWRRAEIVEVPCNGLIKVFGIDHGLTEYVDWRCIRILKNNYKNVDAQAVQIALTHIKCNNANEWTEEANEFLLKQLENKITSMVVDEESKQSLMVTLYECHQEEDVCINALLVKQGLALSTGDKSQQLKLIKDTKVEYYRQMSTSMIMDDKYWVAVDIVHVDSPGSFYVIPLKWTEKRDKFTKELADFYSEEKSPENKWAVDAVCVAKSKEDHLYYRAIIVDVLKSDRYKVFMKDIVRTEILSTKELYALEDQFGVHDYTIKCRLGGMVPAGGENRWPQSAKEYFNQVLELYSHLYITQSEPVSDKILPVELIAKWEDNNGPLNAASVHKAVLNALIIEAGLAIPIKSYTNDSKLNESDKIEPLRFERIPITDEEEDETVSPFLGPKPTEWLKPYRLQEKKFQAWPSYVDHDGFIYIHTTKTKSMLANVRRVLDKYFKDKSCDKNHVWNVGDMCTVQYHLDKTFCRGTVIDTTADGKIHVQLVDYGNVEECTPEELRTDVLMTDQPPLTIKCALANVIPKTVDNKWPLTILDTLHMTIVEKECEAFLENDDYQDDQLPEITLIINHICINTTIMTWDWGKLKKEVRIMDKAPSTTSEDDKSVIIVDSSDDDAQVNEEDADVVLETEIKYTYVLLPENKDTFEGVVVNFIDYQTVLVEPDFIQELMNDTTDEFKKILMDINQFAPYLPKITEPTVGLPCIALFGADNFWYRAEILKVDRKEIKVLFVDYGNIEIIPLDDIKEIKEEWLEFSVQMLKCTISGIQVSPLKDNLEVTLQMKEEIEGKHVVCQILKYEPDIQVKLMSMDNPEVYSYQKLIDDDYIIESN